MDLDQARVYREYSINEYGRVDIVIDCAPDIFCMVEVKLHSDEGETQTNRYFEWVEKSVKQKYRNVLCCFLTPTGIDAENTYFVPLSFRDLFTVFSEIAEDVTLRDNTEYLFNNYKQWIKGLMPTDKNIKEQCRIVYSKYKHEIDLITNNAPTIKAFFHDVSLEFNVNNHDNFAHCASDWLTISPKKWIEDKELKDTTKYSKIRAEYIYSNNNLYFCIAYPNIDTLHNFVTSKFKLLTGQDFDESKMWKNWGHIYCPIETVEDFITENFAPVWEEKITYYKNDALEKTNNLFAHIDVEQIRNLLKSTIKAV